MRIMRAALNKYKALKDPVGYAKSIGVNVVGGVISSRAIIGEVSLGW